MNDTIVFIDDQRDFDSVIKSVIRQIASELVICSNAADGIQEIR